MKKVKKFAANVLVVLILLAVWPITLVIISMMILGYVVAFIAEHQTIFEDPKGEL